MPGEEQNVVNPRGAVHNLGLSCMLRTGVLRHGFHQALGSFGFRRENCDQAISIEIDYGGYKSIGIALDRLLSPIIPRTIMRLFQGQPIYPIEPLRE